MLRHLAAALLLAVPASAGAQDVLATAAPAAPPTEAVLAALAMQAQDNARLGSLLYRYDQAAWHGTDALVGAMGSMDAAAARYPGLEGYVVVPGSAADTLDTLFYARDGDTLRSVARITIRGDEAIATQLLDPAVALDPAALRLAGLRTTMLTAARERGLGLCSGYAANTIILPAAEDGTQTGYLLTSTQEIDRYPAGGHYRFTFDRNGAISSVHAFTQTCIDVTWDPQNEELNNGVFYLTAPNDAAPSEIHAFIGHYVPFALGIVTNNSLIWPMIGGQVDQPVPFDPETGDTP